MPPRRALFSSLVTSLKAMMTCLLLAGSVETAIADDDDVIDSLPANVRAAIRENVQDCESVSYGDGIVQRGTFGVDGTDYSYIVVSFANVKCGESSSYFCGATGNCSHLVFVKAGADARKYIKVADDSFIDVYFGSDHGRFTMTIQRHDTDCEGHEPGQACLETRYWNGTTFDEPK